MAVVYQKLYHTVIVEIGGIGPHTRLFLSILVVGDTGANTNLTECPIVIVAEQKAGSGIAGHINVRPSVVVVISCKSREAIIWSRFCHSRFIADVGKCTVSIVVVELISRAL